MSNGLDCDYDLTDYGGHLKSNGYIWVGRYINPGKSEPLTESEARALSKEDLYIVSIWEEGSPTEPGYFTAEAGAGAGNGAVEAARSIGQPAGTSLFFTVDYDAAEADLSAIDEYFAALHPVVREAGYYVGVYGSGKVCQYLWEQGYAGYVRNDQIVPLTWLAQSRGWEGYDTWLPYATIVQGYTTTVEGLDVDLDNSDEDAGGWQTIADQS